MGGHWPVEQVNLDIHRSLFPLLTVHRTRVADPGFKYSGIRIRFSKYDRIRYKTPLKSNLFCSIFFPKSAVSILTFYLPRSDPDKIWIRNPAQFRKPLCFIRKANVTQYSWSKYTMVLILDGSSETGAHVWSEMRIC